MRYVRRGAHESLLHNQRNGNLKMLSQLTAEYKREDLIVFGEEDPVSGTRTKPARTRRTHHLLESRTSSDVVNNCWDSAYPLEAI